MTFANAAQQALTYILEATYGATPSPTPAFLNLRQIANTLNLTRNALVSAEQRSDAQIPFVRMGMNNAAGGIDFELSHLALKDWVRAFLRYDTTGGSFQSTANTDTLFVNATSKITRTSGSFVSDGALVNMKIRVTGAGESANNTVFTVTVVTALEITVSESLVQEAASAAVKIQGEYAENGVTDSSFSVERQWTDLVTPLYDLFTGVVPVEMSISAQPDSMITGSFTTIAQAMATSTGTEDASTDDINTAEAVDSFTGTLEEGGAASAIVTAFDMTATWNAAGTPVIGSSQIQSVETGRLNVTGTISAYFQDAVLLNKFLNETESSLRLAFQDAASPANEFNLFIPALKYTGADRSPSGDEPLVMNMPFQAFLDGTTGKTLIVNMITGTAV